VFALTVLTVTLSAGTCLAQGDLYAPINAPVIIYPSAAQVLADLYRDAMMKPLAGRVSHDVACVFGHMAGDSIVVAGFITRDSIVITRVTAVPPGKKCPSSPEYIGSLGFVDGIGAPEAEARIAWTAQCDNLQDTVGPFLMAFVYGILPTEHAGPTLLLWGCYRLLPFREAPLHVLK
jgi:hypothetical protein